MLIPAERLLAALQVEFGKLMPRLSDGATDGSATQGIGNAITLLRNRERGGAALVDNQLDSLADLLNRIAGISGGRLTAQISPLRTAITDARDIAELPGKEATWREILGRFQLFAVDIAKNSRIPGEQRKAVMREFIAWEAGDREAQVAVFDVGDTSDAVDITRDNLSAYLRDHFHEPDMHVTSLTPLAGGFGKETLLFDVAGKALSGSFVMRRDLAGGASLTNDCHRIYMEYPVIKAAHARGFPAPDALWLDTDHRLLLGGDFIVMRKSPGQIGGNFFGAQTAVPDSLVDSLGDIMARLHSLPPLTELGELGDAIRPDLWNKSRGETTHDYVNGWRDYFLANNHMPSPSLMALFGWLLDNVPEREGRSVMLHGDFGFHNFLFDAGELTAVLDWEFAHIGDPAEELGYVRETVGDAIDWDRLVARYNAAGGEPVDARTLQYFRVWAHVRNAAASNLVSANFVAGFADDLKLAFLPHIHFPLFIRAAERLIAAT